MGVLVRMEKECELLVLLLDGVEVGKGFHLEDAIPVRGSGGIGSGAEDSEGGDHGRDTIEFGAEFMGSLGVFEGGFEIGVLVPRLC